MMIIALWILLCLIGFILTFISIILPSPFNMVMPPFGGFIMFMCLMQIIGIAKGKGFLALYRNLKENEYWAWVPTHMGKLKLYVLKQDHKGVLFHKLLGLFEHKGTEWSFGNNPMVFAFPESGYTVDIVDEQYFSMLQREEGLETWDAVVKTYLGAAKYAEFCKQFRHLDKPTIMNINQELDWLHNQVDPENPLSKTVFGETVDFRNRCQYLKYTYDPTSSMNATERERLWALKEGMDYKDKQLDQNISRAKAIVYILMGLMIFLIVLTQLDLSNLGKLFGGS